MTIVSKKKDFLALTEEECSGKTDNLIEKAPAYVESGILSKEETDDLIADLKELERLRKAKNAARIEAKNARKRYRTSKKPVDKKLRKYKKSLENNPLVTIDVMQDLGFVNEVKTEDTNHMKPDLRGQSVAGVPHICYTKGLMEGIKLYGKVNDSDFDFQATVNATHFDDTRFRLNPKMVEIREYYAYYMYEGKKVGRKSDLVRIVLEPIE